MSEPCLTERLNPYPRGSNEALAWACGLEMGAKAWCPVCGRIFETLHAIGDPEKKPVGNTDPRKGRRITCSTACGDVESDRVMKPELERASQRYADGIRREKEAEEKKAEAARAKKLKKIGEP